MWRASQFRRAVCPPLSACAIEATVFVNPSTATVIGSPASAVREPGEPQRRHAAAAHAASFLVRKAGWWLCLPPPRRCCSRSRGSGCGGGRNTGGSITSRGSWFRVSWDLHNASGHLVPVPGGRHGRHRSPHRTAVADLSFRRRGAGALARPAAFNIERVRRARFRATRLRPAGG